MELSDKISKIEWTDESIESIKEQNSDLKKHNHILQDKMELLSNKQSQSEKDRSLLSLALVKTKAELKETKDRMFLLENENKIVLQEKSVIQGQFIQLQSSI